MSFCEHNKSNRITRRTLPSRLESFSSQNENFEHEANFSPLKTSKSDTSMSSNATLSASTTQFNSSATSLNTPTRQPLNSEQTICEMNKENQIELDENSECSDQRSIPEVIRDIVQEKSAECANALSNLQNGIRNSDMKCVRDEAWNLLHVGGPEFGSVGGAIKVGIGISTILAGHAIPGGAMILWGAAALGACFAWNQNRDDVRNWLSTSSSSNSREESSECMLPTESNNFNQDVQATLPSNSNLSELSRDCKQVVDSNSTNNSEDDDTWKKDETYKEK